MMHTHVDYLTEGSKWKNELESVMTVKKVHQPDGESGYFIGTYESAVGNAEKTYELHGRFDKEGSTLGWVVSFQNQFRNANSTTTWSGRVLKEGMEKPTIQTTWILNRTKKPECKDCQKCNKCKKHTEEIRSKEETSAQKTWDLQHIGFDKFTRQN